LNIGKSGIFSIPSKLMTKGKHLSAISISIEHHNLLAAGMDEKINHLYQCSPHDYLEHLA